VGDSALTLSHDPLLIVLSVVLAVQGSYVALVLSRNVVDSEGVIHRFGLAATALCLATGIWAMHFVGMLAADLPNHVDYLVLPTLASFLICALVVGCGVYATTWQQARIWRVLGGGLFMGLGITAMHYVGMLAVHADDVHMQHSMSFVLLSMLVAVFGSVFAVWMMEDRGLKPALHPRLLWASALILGLAVAGMHYLAMAGMHLSETAASGQGTAPALSRGSLALIVAVVAFLVSGVFLLILIPTRPLSRNMHGDHAAQDAPLLQPSTLPSKSSARQIEPQTIAVRGGGGERALPLAQIYAVKASGHYTTIFDGKQEYFCQMPISAIEAHLESDHFMRVHRSFIVNLAMISALKRNGDEGIADLKADVRFSVPVARSRYNALKKRLQLRAETDSGLGRASAA
jgi:diguanylate cyclase